MDNWIKDLSVFIMPCRHPVVGYEKEYFAAYAVWRSAWEKFYKDIGVKEHLNSDGFVLPDEMVALFYKGDCVGFCSYTHGSLAEVDTMKDLSWFRSWTPSALEELRRRGPDCMFASQFTVSPKFTGKDQVVRWKEIVFMTLFLHLEHGDCHTMAGHLNVTRGMHNAGGGSNGATVFDAQHSFDFHGVKLDSQLVAYEKHVVTAHIDRSGQRLLANAIWDRTVDLRGKPQHMGTPKSPIKKIA